MGGSIHAVVGLWCALRIQASFCRHELTDGLEAKIAMDLSECSATSLLQSQSYMHQTSLSAAGTPLGMGGSLYHMTLMDYGIARVMSNFTLLSLDSLILLTFLSGLLLICLGCKSDKPRRCCSCPGFCGGCFMTVALPLIALKLLVIHLAGPEPARPMLQSPPEMDLRVTAVVPFSALEINTEGPVRTLYIDGMQGALDTMKRGVKVLDVAARPANGVALQEVRSSSPGNESNRLVLVYRGVARGGAPGGSKPLVSEQVFVKSLQDEARQLTKSETPRRLEATESEIPQRLKDIAAGRLPAANSVVQGVQVHAAVVCQAHHNLDEGIRAGVKILARRHGREVRKKLNEFAERAVPGFALQVADRCNDPSQSQRMRMCFGKENVWVNFVAPQAVDLPSSSASVEDFLCRSSCRFAGEVQSLYTKVIERANEDLNSRLDENVLYDIVCTPSLPEGQHCEKPCT
eukprot:TRINITY_DN28949_c0_g1_i1.p1 TRINITY_DN28949_c0_g1~~TRINITY_DN28949_c0_g1_i1.p1  ORF type:complete len:461 (+),score=38.44 TRINITY_DN28949_c0_g1_i1:48-1430(+)